MQNLLKFDIHRRIILLHKAICTFFLIGIAITLSLWHGQRLFPLVPVIPGMPPLPKPLDYILLGLFAGLLALNIARFRRMLTALLLAAAALMVFLDQMRLQPWVLIYFLALIPFALADFQDEKMRQKYGVLLLGYVQVLLIGVYFWSGLHKFTQSFIDIVYPLLIKGLFRVEDGSWLMENRQWGYVAAVVELSIGLGLIFTKTRNFAVIGAILTHLLIIAWVSPLGGNANYVILPWNAAMIALVLLGAYGMKNRISLRPPAHARLGWATAALALLVWLMPALNLINKWDAYLSFNLYTERISHMYVALRGETLGKTDARLSAYYASENLIEEGKVIDVEKWSFAELKVPVYPAQRVHKAIGRYFCKPPANPDQVMLVTYRRPFVEGNYEVFFCKDC